MNLNIFISKKDKKKILIIQFCRWFNFVMRRDDHFTNSKQFNRHIFNII